MKKVKKTTLLFLLTLICLWCCSCGESLPPESPIKDFTYEFVDGNAIITGYIGTDLDIVVPRIIENRPVTVIGEEAFSSYDMNSIILPESLVEIDYKAFENCKQLKEIIIPKNVNKVETAFDGCENLEKIQIPEEVSEFYDDLKDTKWYKNQNDGVVYINNNVIGIKGDIPTEVKIADGTKSIHRLYRYLIVYGLTDNEGGTLKRIHIPESVTYIREESVGYKEFYKNGFKQADKTVTIYGKEGSYAEQYAQKHNITFKSE